jgi:membrane protease YdiL (CAAX protease family)
MSQPGPSQEIPATKLPDVLALLFAMSFPTFLAWMNFFVLPGTTPESNPFLQWFFGVGKAIQFTFPLIYVSLFERQQLWLPGPTRRGLGVGVAFGFLVGLVTFGLYFGGLKGTVLFEETSPKIHDYMAQFNLPSAEGFLLMAMFIALVHSLWEEYYWRWFVFGRLQRWLPWPGAAVISGLAFMAHHVLVLAFYLPGYFWVAVLPLSLCVAAGGAVWAWMYHRYQSLYAPWVSHCLVDMAIMVVGYDLLRPFLK